MIRYLISVIVIILSISLKAQLNLCIEINNLINDKGLVLLEFNDGKNNFIKLYKGIINNNKCIINIDNLKPGNYSFKYFHDENNNETLDTYWFKAPKEGYGFSNNAKGNFGLPEFESTIFKIQNDTTVKCDAYYIFN